jgi:hypothetical protein
MGEQPVGRTRAPDRPIVKTQSGRLYVRGSAHVMLPHEAKLGYPGLVGDGPIELEHSPDAPVR